jgi:hypothetical protein
VALGGFLYQLYLSLDRFFAQVLECNRDARLSFEGLSDIAELKGDIVYLTQVKTTLDNRSLRSAVDEALAVEQFLTDCHPDCKDRVRFQLAARRVGPLASLNIGQLSAGDLGLESREAQLWATVRNKFLPVELRGAPKVDLAIRLWPHAQQCFTLTDTCLGRLFDLLGENRSSTEITEALLEVWDRARAHEGPPCHLLGAREFSSPRELSITRVLHGVRPRPEDLRDGCFMGRPAFLEGALNIIREASIQIKTSLGQEPIPVFWIVGPSGAGKSVLLLQVMRDLIIQADVEVANYLGEFAHALPRALAYWSGASERALIVVDDLFAPENRDPQLWREVAEVAFTSTWRRVPWILTCGPTEQLRAFKNEANRHRELLPFEIPIEPMKLQEQDAYHSWYQERTCSQVPKINEPILVAAAWMYELYRQAGLSPGAFASRFYSRMADLELQVPVRAAIALNQYGLKAPEGLFAGREAELDQLTSEQIYRLAQPREGVRLGRFFHPRVARIIYDAIVPEGEIRRRAEDLACGFGKMLDTLDAAGAFLTWLEAPRTQSLVGPLLRKETLAAIWSAFRDHELSESVVPLLKRWHEMLRLAETSLADIGASGRVADWLERTPEDAPSWGLLFQIVWDETDKNQRAVLCTQGQTWLTCHLEFGSWNWIWQRMWAYRPNTRDMLDLGFVWLYDNPTHPGWGRVWQCIYDSGCREPDLLTSALEALPLQPESPADLPIWQKIEKLQPNREAFIAGITRKLSRVRNPYKMNQGIDFLLKLTGNISNV